MIRRLSHATIYRHDQDDAKAFYADTIGFEVKADDTLDGFRWPTVGPAESDLELVLMPVRPGPMMDGATAEKLAELLAAGALGTGVFETDDCQKTFEELSVAASRSSRSPPSDRTVSRRSSGTCRATGSV